MTKARCPHGRPWFAVCLWCLPAPVPRRVATGTYPPFWRNMTAADLGLYLDDAFALLWRPNTPPQTPF